MPFGCSSPPASAARSGSKRFALAPLDFVDAGRDTIIVVSGPREVGGYDWPEETATTILFRDGKVIDMQDYSTRGEAVASLS